MKDVYCSYYTESEDITSYMVSKIGICANDLILEPSAGEGTFIDEILKRKVKVRIDALDINENPTEEITGRITDGSINVDGKSAVRRTCSLTMVAQDVNINDFYWGLNTKFKMYVGITNNIDKKYKDVSIRNYECR